MNLKKHQSVCLCHYLTPVYHEEKSCMESQSTGYPRYILGTRISAGEHIGASLWMKPFSQRLGLHYLPVK